MHWSGFLRPKSYGVASKGNDTNLRKVSAPSPVTVEWRSLQSPLLSDLHHPLERGSFRGRERCGRMGEGWKPHLFFRERDLHYRRLRNQAARFRYTNGALQVKPGADELYLPLHLRIVKRQLRGNGQGWPIEADSEPRRAFQRDIRKLSSGRNHSGLQCLPSI